MRRFPAVPATPARLVVTVALAVAPLVTASCSSSSPPSAATSASPPSTTTSTLDPAVQEAADRQGARAVVTLFAARLQRSEPGAVTQAMVDCLPDALIDAIGAHDLLVLFNGTPFDQLTAADRAGAVAAFRGCGFADDVLRRIGLLAG